MGLTLTGATNEKEDMSPILTKTIIQGFVDLNQTKATFATIGGGTTTAIATRHKIKVFCDGHLLGVPILNDCKITSPFTAGETGQTDSIDVAAYIVYKGVYYPLYADANGADTRATIAAGARCELMLDGAIPVFAGDTIYVQTAWIGAASTTNCPRHNVVNLNEDEGYLFFDSGTASTDAAAAIAAIAGYGGVAGVEWLPVVGNQQKSEMTANTTRMPAPAGLLMRVKGNQRHIAIRGTSRSIGNKNWYSDPSLYNDSFLAAACAAKSVPYINNAIGSAIGANDEDNPQYSANRRWLEQGATEIWDEHLQNDLANDLSLGDIMRRMLKRAAEARALGQRIVGFTVDPYTTTSVTGDWTLSSTQTVADSDTSTKRTAMRNFLKGTTSTLSGSGSTATLQQVYDRVLLTSEVVESSTSPTLWADATVADTGTATSTSASTLVQSTKTWTPYAYPERYVVTLTAADAVTKGIVLSNAPASLAVTSTTLTLTSAGWSNGTAGNKAYTIYNTVTNDGLHATFYGNRLKQAVVESYLGGTSSSFSLASIPWQGFWIAHPAYLFTDTGCSANVVSTDPVQVWVDCINGLKATGTTTARPTYSPTSTYGAILFDGTDDQLVFTTALATIAQKQHRIAIVTVLECPDSNSTARSLFYISNNVGNTRVHVYFETGGGTSTGLPASISRVDEAGTQNSDNWSSATTAGTYIVRIDYVDWQDGKQYGWINGTIKLDDAAAWAASKGLSVDTASSSVVMGRGVTTPLNCRVVAIGVVNNFEMTPYIVSSLSTYLGTVSNWMPTGF